jgi:hypothetical protein
MNRACCVAVAVMVCVLLALPTLADTLFKGKVALAIGHGTQKGDKLHWTDCDGTNPKEYAVPPYWIDAAANCQISPDSFGLAFPKDDNEQDQLPEDVWTKLSIRDATSLKSLFPHAKAGDTVMFYKGKGSIKLKWHKQMQELRTQSTKQ